MLYIILLLSIVIHELGHILAILITKAGVIKRLHLSWKGIGIEWEAENPSIQHRIIISSAGSAANIIVGIVLLLLQMPEYAYINFLCGFLNLVPFLKGDGYNILKLIQE